MITWGTSKNGAWKLGYEISKTAETSTYVDYNLDVYIWVRYPTYESNNTFRITGSWTYSDPAVFDLQTNAAWSQANIGRIFRQTKRFNKVYGGVTVSFNASLTGVTYPSESYVETVSGSASVESLTYSAPAAPTNVKATRVSDGQIVLSWTNNNPNATTAPYQGLAVNVVQTVKGKDEAVYLGNQPVNSELVFASTIDRKYVFNIYAYNKDAQSARVYSNVVYTTPAPVILGNVAFSGIDAIVSWDHTNPSILTGYDVKWTGPTSGSTTTTGTMVKLTNLRPDASYTVSVIAKNPSLSSPAATMTFKTPNPPLTKPEVKWGTPRITGGIEPRTSSIPITIIPVLGASSYRIYTDDILLTTTVKTNDEINVMDAGSTFTYSVAAVNALGEGPRSDPVKIALPGLPGAPTVKFFYSTPQGYVVELGPGEPNGSPISAYEYMVTADGREVSPWTRQATSFIDSNLQPGRTYMIHVRSINGVGTGPSASAMSDATGGRIYVHDGMVWQPTWAFVKDGPTIVRVYKNGWVLTAV